MVVFIGLYSIWILRKRWLGLSLVIFGSGIFIFEIFVILPRWLDTSPLLAGRYSYLGSETGEVIKNFFVRPDLVFSHLWCWAKMKYIIALFGPLGFLSLLNPSHLFLTFPILLQNLMSDYESQYSIIYPHSSACIPFVFISAIWGFKKGTAMLSRIWKKPSLPRWGMILLLAVTFSCFGVSRPFRIILEPVDRDFHQCFHRIMQMIPKDASVASQWHLMAHQPLTHRPELYSLFPPVLNLDGGLTLFKSTSWVIKEVDWVLIDTSTSPPPESNNWEGFFQEVLLPLGFIPAANEGDLLLLNKNK